MALPLGFFARLMMEAQAPQSAVIEFLTTVADIELWIDGGWGVDALLERQTRPHLDLDIIVCASAMGPLIERLTNLGYTRREGDGAVFDGPQGLAVDVHQVRFDEAGFGIFDLPDGREWPFPPPAFAGRGRIGSMSVRCLSADAQVQCHSQGYTPTPKDIADMLALQARFQVALPPSLGARPRSGT